MTRITVFFIVGAVACAPRPDLDAERAAIMVADSAWLAAAPAGDIDSALPFWTEDAHVIAPRQQPSVGRDAVRPRLTDVFSAPCFAVCGGVTGGG